MLRRRNWAFQISKPLPSLFLFFLFFFIFFSGVFAGRADGRRLKHIQGLHPMTFKRLDMAGQPRLYQRWCYHLNGLTVWKMTNEQMSTGR